MLEVKYEYPAKVLRQLPDVCAQFDVAADDCRLLQAQYLRVPLADFNALPLPPGTAHEASFALL